MPDFSAMSFATSLYANQGDYNANIAIEISSMVSQEQFLELFEAIASFVPDGTVVRINNMTTADYRWELEQTRCEL